MPYTVLWIFNIESATKSQFYNSTSTPKFCSKHVKTWGRFKNISFASKQKLFKRKKKDLFLTDFFKERDRLPARRSRLLLESKMEGN